MANQILDSKKMKNRNKKEKTMLHDLLYCKECNKKLSRKDNDNVLYYYCITRTNFHLCDNSSYLPYHTIENEVIKYIAEIIKKYSNKDTLKQLYINEYKKNKSKINEYEDMISKLSQELLKNNNKLDIIYNDKLNNVITMDMYKKHSSTIKEEQQKLEKKIKDINGMIYIEEQKIESLKNNEKKINDIIDKFYTLSDINIDIVNEFIEKIFIDKNRKIYVKLKFGL